MYLLGYDIGSSSVKAALVDARTGKTAGLTHFPDREMTIDAPKANWAEQAPERWWECLVQATHALLKKTKVEPGKIQSIGIAYQMHGLVLIDRHQQVLRPAIIWCDSRAVPIGEKAFKALGPDYCLQNLLNAPGNFTASKLKWVKQNEPEIYDRIYKVLLPGDYIALRLSGVAQTTVAGLSEGIFWDFKANGLSKKLFKHYGFKRKMIPEVVDTFGEQSKLNQESSKILGLPAGIPIAYRAGDQPNNALSLGVFKPGQIAATGGTSGVVYGIADKLVYDRDARVNSFAHVNHAPEKPRVGVLLCINGAGSQYAWIKRQIAGEGLSYRKMEEALSDIPVGADDLRILPFGNGAERMLHNTTLGANILNLQFNRHSQAHLFRAALEGIAFSFVYGFQLLSQFGLDPSVVRVGNDNLFQSSTFSTTIATLLDTKIEVRATTGAAGAAKAAGFGAGIYESLEEAFSTNQVETVFIPDREKIKYESAYRKWEADLYQLLKNSVKI